MEFTQEELQNIRHLAGASTNLCAKITYYSNSIPDEEVKHLFTKVCDTCTELKSYLVEKL